MERLSIRCSALALLLTTPFLNAFADSSVQQRTESLKQQVVELNRELSRLEEELLYPANTQVVVFLAINTKKPFTLDSVELKVNGDLATTYLYSDREISALNRGGVQRLYMGNLASGGHRIEAVFNGRSADDRYFRQQVSYNFEKQSSAKFVELVVQESRQDRLPEFLIRELQ